MLVPPTQPLTISESRFFFRKGCSPISPFLRADSFFRKGCSPDSFFSERVAHQILFQKGLLTQQRLAALLGTKIFDRVRKEKEEVTMNMIMGTIS